MDDRRTAPCTATVTYLEDVPCPHSPEDRKIVPSTAGSTRRLAHRAHCIQVDGEWVMPGRIVKKCERAHDGSGHHFWVNRHITRQFYDGDPGVTPHSPPDPYADWDVATYPTHTIIHDGDCAWQASFRTKQDALEWLDSQREEVQSLP